MENKIKIDTEDTGVKKYRKPATIFWEKSEKFEIIRKSWLHMYPENIKDKKLNHSQIVRGNNEGLSPGGKRKLIEFFLKHPVSYRKILSFIILKQKITDKYIVISDESICKFSGIKKEDLDKVLYFLEKTVHLIRTDRNTYRLPAYIWDSDVLKKVKKLEKKWTFRKN